MSTPPGRIRLGFLGRSAVSSRSAPVLPAGGRNEDLPLPQPEAVLDLNVNLMWTPLTRTALHQ